MGSAIPMAVLVVILAVLMVGAFLAVWLRDRSRSHEQSDDSGRLGADPSQRRRNRGR